MSPFKIVQIVFTVSFLELLSGLSGTQDIITINVRTDASSKIIKIPQNYSYIISAADIPAGITVLIYKAHTQVENVMLSEERKALIHSRVTGKNIGLAVKLHVSETEKHVWLTNLSQKELSVLISISPLDSHGPTPGGCNMEFPTEISPYLKIKTDTMRIYLEYQHASFGFPRDQPPPKCSLSSSYITYEIYVLFLEENNFGEEEFFKKVEFMSNVSSIKTYASKAESYSLHPDTRYSFLMYPNLGVVYNVVAKYSINNEVKEAPYVPIVSYGCTPFDFTENGCRIIYSIKGRVFLFFLSIYGFMVAFFGHSFIGSVIFFFGLLASYLIGFILLGKYLSYSKDTTAWMSIVAGVTGGILCLILWLWLRNPAILMLLNGLVFGFLFSATVFYTPIGNFEIFINNTNFWSLLSVGTLFTAVLSLAVPRQMTVVGPPVVGCYIMLLFYDDFVGTRLSYIILNIVKRAVSKNLSFANNDVPFQIKDILMSTIWAIFSFISIFIWYKKTKSTGNRVTYATSNYFVPSVVMDRPALVYTLSEDDNTQQPLLRGNNPSIYQTF